MGMVRVLSRAGDDVRVWDLAAVEAGDTEAAAAVREAERMFNKHRASSGSAYVMEHGRATAKIIVFDATAELILLVPAVIGG